MRLFTCIGACVVCQTIRSYISTPNAPRNVDAFRRGPMPRGTGQRADAAIRLPRRAGTESAGLSAPIAAARRPARADECRGGSPRIADIAYRQGFLELGRFAADYRRLLGELPSETLAHHRAVALSPLLLD